MKLLPDSLGGRLALILVGGIGLLHAVTLGIYDLDRVSVLGDAGLDRISERVASDFRLAERAKPIHRAAIPQDLSDPTITLTWDQQPVLTNSGTSTESHDMMFDLRDWLSLPPDRVLVNSKHHGSTLVSVHLTDGSWINARGAPITGDSGTMATLVVSNTLAAAGILIMTLFLVRWVTAPLRRLSQAADRLGVKLDSPPLAETGPLEVRHAAQAFNAMQARVQRFVSDRTQMFAAISHDLKTPITRLKLRAEFTPDEAERIRMLRDLGDMEHMITSLLTFLRDEMGEEETRLVDMVALVKTICDDFADAGHDVELKPVPTACTLPCRSNAVKRALSNLIDNAVKYGGRAMVTLEDHPEEIQLTIADDGPGIPVSEQERMFAPFQRLDMSRNRDTGGTGLGLTIARTILRSHGGDVTLNARLPHGLSVQVMFPKIRK